MAGTHTYNLSTGNHRAKAAREDLSGRGYLGGCCCSVFGLAAS
jgi:hypothetical protein